MAAIWFDPDLMHVLGFRHCPRAARPPVGNVWDFHMGLSEKAPLIAKKTRELYFPDLIPEAMRFSQIPRSLRTLELLWPNFDGEVKKDRRLGIDESQVSEWQRSISSRMRMI